MWHDMLVVGVPPLERVIRAAAVYVFAVAALRLAGKHELGTLSTLDLVVLLFFSNILQDSIIGNDLSVTGGVIGAATLLVLNHVVLRALYGRKRLDEVVEGRATYLIQNGQLLEENLRRELVTIDELLVACHKQGVLDLDAVEQAVLEPDGTITVFARIPTPDELGRQEILNRLDALGQRLDLISARLDGPRA